MDPGEIGLSAFHTVLAVVGLIVIGIVLRVIGVLKPEADKSLFSLAVNLLTPCLILDNVLFSTALSDIRNIVFPPLIGFGCVAVSLALAWGFAKLAPALLSGLDNAREAGTFAACIAVFNYGFVPIPLIAVLFPSDDRISGILFLQNLGVDISVWTLIIVAISGHWQRGSWKKVINPPTLAIFSSVVIHLLLAIPGVPRAYLAEHALPCLDFFRQTVHMLGCSAIPLTVLLVGATIAEHFEGQRLRREWKRGLKIVFWSSLLRLGVLPLLFILLAVSLPGSLPAATEIKRILVIHGAMSSAVFPIVMAKYYGGDSPTAFYTVLGNTIFSIATAPLWIAYGLSL